MEAADLRAGHAFVCGQTLQITIVRISVTIGKQGSVGFSTCAIASLIASAGAGSAVRLFLLTELLL